MHPNQFNIVYKEVNRHSRTIKEAMFIHLQDPPLNRNPGKYQLLHIWDHLLQASPTLQCKPTNQPTNQLYSHITPPTGSPLPPHNPTPSHYHYGGVTQNFPMVSTHMYPKYPPLLIYKKSNTSTILVSFLYFIS